MQIPPFALPSNPAITIHLREATVADCEQFADSDRQHEERVATTVLRALQSNPEAYSDPIGWSVDDRVLAAFWYHAHTATDSSIHLPYTCPNCGEPHDALVNLTELADYYQPIQGRPYRDLTHEGESYRVVPLDGYAAEELEGLRAEAGEPGTAEHERMMAIIERHRIVASLVPADFKGVRDQRIAEVEERIRRMPLSQFEALREKVDAAQVSMAHGLPTAVTDGEVLLVTPPIPCEKEAGQNTRLRFPFQWGDYLPRLR